MADETDYPKRMHMLASRLVAVLQEEAGDEDPSILAGACRIAAEIYAQEVTRRSILAGASMMLGKMGGH